MPGHRVFARVRLAPDRQTTLPVPAPPIEPGNRGFYYRFESLDADDPKPIELRAVVESTEETASNDYLVNIWFWADKARRYATKGATFGISYGGIIGEGEVLLEIGLADQTGSSSVEFSLTARQRQVMRAGLLEWGGPSNCTSAMARAMGFKSVETLFEQSDRLRERLRHSEPLSEADWARSLLATEICFASSLGSRDDWQVTTGFSDVDTIELLRELQRRLASATAKLRAGELF